MFELIGETVRRSMDTLPWSETVGGFCEPVTRDDGGIARTFPAAIGTSGEILNMSPHDGASCILFTDSEDALKVMSVPTQRLRMGIAFRVVAWYDERMLVGDTGQNVGITMVSEIARRVKKCAFQIPILTAQRTDLIGVEYDASRIWARYRMGIDDRALFVHPYRTLAVTFELSGLFNEKCDCGKIIKTAKC
jgi:hypothetical protein